jgi:hypothetical protein
MAASKHGKGQACRVPVLFGKKDGNTWRCNVCGARFVFRVSQGTDRYGRKIRGHGSWIQIGG